MRNRHTMKWLWIGLLLTVSWGRPRAAQSPVSDRKVPNLSLPDPARTWNSPGHTTYYVDSLHGDDASSGTSAAHAWRTLGKINTGTFASGDKILLKCGSHWQGFLCPGGSGTAGNPILLGCYGRGPKPAVEGSEQTLAAVYLHNVQFWEIEDLDITNTGPFPVVQLDGVAVSVDNYGDAHHIVLNRLFIHDVTGSEASNPNGGCGIRAWRGDGGKPSRFDGLTIENCRLTHVDRNGILMDGNVWRTHWYPNLHVVIRGNVLEDIGGDGIVPIACDGAVVEHNIIRGACERAEGYAAGIYPWSCDNTTIEYNEVSGVKGTNDGQGYDCDFNCRNTLMQYNYSHDNEGGFMLICNDGEFKSPMSAGNVGSVIRYNVSINDGFHIFTLNGPCRDTQIYNNVIYVGDRKAPYLLACGNWGGAWAETTRFYNNIFYTAPGNRPAFDMGGMTDILFDHNAFWGEIQNRPPDAHALLVNPMLSAPGSKGAQSCSLLTGSPCLYTGRIVAGNGGRDFAGSAVSPSLPPSLGAFQKPVSRRSIP